MDGDKLTDDAQIEQTDVFNEPEPEASEFEQEEAEDEEVSQRPSFLPQMKKGNLPEG